MIIEIKHTWFDCSNHNVSAHMFFNTIQNCLFRYFYLEKVRRLKTFSFLFLILPIHINNYPIYAELNFSCLTNQLKDPPPLKIDYFEKNIKIEFLL